jgi:hypothetical protein
MRFLPRFPGKCQVKSGRAKTCMASPLRLHPASSKTHQYKTSKKGSASERERAGALLALRVSFKFPGAWAVASDSIHS